MFDFSQIFELMKLDSGHSILQSVLLFMIWIQSRGLRQEMGNLKRSLQDAKSTIDKRIENLEQRLIFLEEKRMA